MPLYFLRIGTRITNNSSNTIENKGVSTVLFDIRTKESGYVGLWHLLKNGGGKIALPELKAQAETEFRLILNEAVHQDLPAFLFG